MQIWNKKIDWLIFLSLTLCIKILHLRLNKYRKLSLAKSSPPVKSLEVLWKVLIFWQPKNLAKLLKNYQSFINSTTGTKYMDQPKMDHPSLLLWTGAMELNPLFFWSRNIKDIKWELFCRIASNLENQDEEKCSSSLLEILPNLKCIAGRVPMNFSYLSINKKESALAWDLNMAYS